VFGGAGGHDVPVGRDDLRRDEAVDGEPVLPHQEPDATARHQPSHADRRGVAGGERQAVFARRRDEVAGGRARLDAGDPRLRLDDHALHLREIDDDGVVDHAVARQAVTAAPHRQLQALRAGEGDGARHIRRAPGADDHRGVAVVFHVLGATNLVIADAVGIDHLANQTLLKLPNRPCGNRAAHHFTENHRLHPFFLRHSVRALCSDSAWFKPTRSRPRRRSLNAAAAPGNPGAVARIIASFPVARRFPVWHRSAH
jgi:hypothetical protein